MSLRETIAAASDITTEKCPVPEWGVDLELRVYSLDVRSALMEMQSSAQDGDKINFAQFQASVIIAGCYDPTTGEPVFTDGDQAMIRGKNATILDKIVERILEMNNMGPESVEAGKDGSSGTPTDGGSSSSPPDSE